MVEKIIKKKLATIPVPYLEKSIEELATFELNVNDKNVEILINVGFPIGSIKTSLIAAISDELKNDVGTRDISVSFNQHIQSHVGNPAIKAFANIKNMIAVGSGKGGVGKSTLAFNIALALKTAGANVGLLDADIYGPSQPLMLGTLAAKPTITQRILTPIQVDGLQTMSIGNLVDKQAPMMWRGPMLGKAMQQLLVDTAWDNLDYLIIDLPPGTGDVQLTLFQKIPLSAGVLVTTPQDIALLDVRRAYEMFLKLNIPVLGAIENMATYTCHHCGHETAIFGTGGGDQLVKEYDLPLLGRLPLDPIIRQFTDTGCTNIAAQTKNPYAKSFSAIATRIAGQLSLQRVDYSAKFPKITVER